MYDGATGAGHGFIQYTDAVEVYLIVEGVLKGGRDIVGVVVDMVVAGVGMEVGMFVVVVVRHVGSGLKASGMRVSALECDCVKVMGKLLLLSDVIRSCIRVANGIQYHCLPPDCYHQFQFGFAAFSQSLSKRRMA